MKKKEIPDWAKDPDPDSEAGLTITQNEDDDNFDVVEKWLEQDSRVIAFGRDYGRHYTVPDGDELGEWHAIRITTLNKYREDVKDDLQKWLDTEHKSDCLTVNYF